MYRFKATDRWYKEAAEMEEGHEISAGAPKKVTSVLTGARVEVFIKNRRLKAATSLSFQADARSVCMARISYLDLDANGRIKQVQLGSELINKENDFQAFVVRVEPVGDKVRFHVMPRSFISDKANDFTVEDEKFLLEEILRACEPEAVQPPPETA